MDQYQHQKTRRVDVNRRHRLTQEDRQNVVNRLRELMERHRNGASRLTPRAFSVNSQTTIPAAPSNPRGALNMRVKSNRKEVPFFKTYEEFHEAVVQSCENISVILNTDGKVVFISQNVSSLLGHHPEDIVGKTLLNILLDEEKEEIARKIILNLPLAKSVGSLIEFCCYVRKRTAGLFNQDAYTYVDMYNRKDTYEYVKFVLYLQDSYDDSFVIFGNYGRSSRNTCSSTTRLLREQRYYLVGTILVLRTRAESGQPAAIQPPVIVIDSDDDNNTQSQRFQKQLNREEIQGKHQNENLNTESPVSSSDVEIVDVTPAPWQKPFELTQVRTPSRSSICTIISTSTSTSVSSSGDFEVLSSLATSTSEQDSMIEAKYRLDLVDNEFEVGSEFLLSDSQEGQTSPESGEFSDEDEKKPLEGATGCKPKEHAIGEVPDASSDDDYCEIVEDTDVPKDPKIQEVVVDQEQAHEKTVETIPKRPSPVAQPVYPVAQSMCPVAQPVHPVADPVCPEAVLEPMVCTDLPTYAVAEPRRALNFQRPLFGERVAQDCGPRRPRRRTEVYDLSTSRTFNEEPPPNREVAEEVVSLINDLGPLPLNFFVNGNSEYPQNETHRLGNDHVNHTYSLLHNPLTRSYQPTYPVFHDPSTRSYQPTYPVPYQPGAATYQPLAATNQPLTRIHHPPARSQYPSTSLQLSTSDYRRESGPHFVPPRQEHPSYFHPDWYIDPHP